MRSPNRKSLFAFALVLVLVVSAVFGYAQVRGTVPVAPVVLSGADLGFRVEGRRENSVVGRFVVRVNGHWVEVDSSFGAQLLTTGR
jgi:hypothetical protein